MATGKDASGVAPAGGYFHNPVEWGQKFYQATTLLLARTLWVNIFYSQHSWRKRGFASMTTVTKNVKSCILTFQPPLFFEFSKLTPPPSPPKLIFLKIIPLCPLQPPPSPQMGQDKWLIPKWLPACCVRLGR